MSERGYDSDARCISANRGFRRMELSDLLERAQERDETESCETVFRRGDPGITINSVRSLPNLHSTSREFGPLGSPQNLSTETMIPTQRHPIASDPRSLHLGEPGPSRLTSQTISSGPMSCSSSIAELVRKNRYGVFLPPSQDSFQPRQDSWISTFSGPEPQSPTTRRQDVSSFYSRPASRPNSNDTSPQVQYKQTETNDLGSPRQVSVGWMSGGRRVGYGYNLVPDAEGRDPSQASKWKPEVAIADANSKTGHDFQPQVRQQHHQGTAESTIRVPEHIPPPPMNPRRHELGAATLPRAKASVQPANEYPAPAYLRAILGARSSGSSRDYEAGTIWVDERASSDLPAPELPPITQIENRQVPRSSSSTDISSASASRWAQLSRSMSAQSGLQKNTKEGSDDHTTLNKGDESSAQEHRISVSGDNADDVPTKHCGTDKHAGEDQACQLRPGNSRSARWVLRSSKRRESRRLSHVHQQEHSQASSGPYLDCDSNSLARANSTKSNAEDLASTYRECLQMPGSFEGSRWANRGSRVLWDLCTREDD